MESLILFDPLFRVPFFNGLVLAVVLSLIGAYLRMRDEWLSAFALSHVAAAGAVLGLPLGLPVALTATLAAGLVVLVHSWLPRVNNFHYGATLLLGWSAALLLAANTQQGSVVAESVLRGQLLFSGTNHLLAVVILLVVLVAFLPWLSSRLMVGRFFPDYFAANRIPVWRHRFLFGACVVFGVVLGTLSLGAVPAFALFFMPSWVAFVLCRGWLQALWVTVAFAVGVYIAAFAFAVQFDQPIGPVLVVSLLLLAPLRCLPIAGR